MAAARSRPWVLWTTLVAVVVIRLLEMRSGAAPDEGGFLVVASQWHSGGTTLYGHYWVDRPPVLITIFGLAHVLGGLLALRLLGILAAVLTLWFLHSTVRRLYGERPAAWAAVVAGALLVSPLYGAVDVNGELFALVFVSLGIRLAVEAVHAEDNAISRGAAVGAGAAAVLAVLTKQNIADVAIFAAAAWLVGWRTGQLTGRRLVSLISYAAVGAVVSYAVVMLWALAHGTSPYQVYEATYPFRVKAGAVIAEDARAESGARLSGLVRAFAGSLVPVLLVAFAAFAVRRGKDVVVLAGLAALLAYGTFSVLAGGSYWLHYLLETVPAVVIATGALASAAPKVVRPVAALVALSGVVAAIAVMFNPTPTPGYIVGQAIAKVAAPGDTIVTAFGDPNMLLAAHMSSPYPYLWSLPARVRDPHLDVLDRVIAGPAAPDWFVVRDARTRARLRHLGVLTTLESRYRVVGVVCGHDIYLRDDDQRAQPFSPAGAVCS
ncbi:MAG: hypothetical protein ACJ72E_11555 [Marmoricola sp.]